MNVYMWYVSSILLLLFARFFNSQCTFVTWRGRFALRCEYLCDRMYEIMLCCVKRTFFRSFVQILLLLTSQVNWAGCCHCCCRTWAESVFLTLPLHEMIVERACVPEWVRNKRALCWRQEKSTNSGLACQFMQLKSSLSCSNPLQSRSLNHTIRLFMFVTHIVIVIVVVAVGAVVIVTSCELCKRGLWNLAVLQAPNYPHF